MRPSFLSLIQPAVAGFARRHARSITTVAALLTVLAPPADAADALRGKTLYAATPGGISCANSSCHGADPTRGTNRILRGANNATVIQNAINGNTGGMGIYRNNVLTTVDVADIAAYLGNPNVTAGPIASASPTSLAFGSVAVGSSSAAQTVTLRNTGTAALSITSIAASNANFVVSGGTCAAGTPVVAAGSCTITVLFRPATATVLTGSLTISHNATGGSTAVALSGTGTAAPAATVSVSPTALTFAAQGIGTTSAVQTITVSNTGGAALSFTSLTFTGANAADFARGGTCAVGTAVSAGASCTASISFTPQSAGARSAALAIASNASNPNVNVALTGTGTAAAQPAVNPASLSFGSVTVGGSGTAQSVTVSNSGTAPMTLAAITSSNAQFAITGGTCATGTVVAASGGSCTVQINFSPTAAGAASANLSIAHNASANALLVALSGTGTVPAAPVAQLSPTTLSYSQVVGGTSSAQTATLSNTGTAPLSITSLTLAGANPADYTLGGGTCAAGGSVAAGASCTVSLTFRPGATGARNALLNVVHSDTTRSPSVLTLNGSGTAQAVGLLSVNRVAFTFAAQASGSTSAAQTATVSNTGSAPLTLTTLGLGGTDPGDFALVTGTAPCAVGTTLAVGATCSVNVTFTPTAAFGARIATLSLAAGTAGSATISLTGTAAPAAAPIVTVNPASLSFGTVTIGQSAATQTVTLSNTGSAALLIASIAATPAGFPLSHNCPSSLAPSASCTLTLGFAPTVVGAATGTVTLVSNAASSPNTLALSGTGAALAPAALAWVGNSTLAFADTAVGSQSAAQTLTLSNTGGSATVLQSFPLAGASAAEFRIDPSSTCALGGSLAGGGSCTLAVVFAPAAAGARSATLAVTSAATAPSTASLSGNGVAGGVPVLGLSPSAITLTGPSNQPLQPQVLVVSNQGAAPLQVTAIQAGSGLSVLDASSTGGGNCRPVPFTLAPGASCTLIVNPLANAVSSGVTITSTASASAQQVPVSGNAQTNVGAASAGGGAGLLLFAVFALVRRRCAA